MKIKALIFLLAFATIVYADLNLVLMKREVFKQGLHRELLTNITYTVTNELDLRNCAFIINENITKDHYIYYEEVTRDMPGFQTWPHHKVMNIEAPTSTSVDEEFIWRLPLNERQPNSYITHYESSEADSVTMPQTNTVTVKFRFHYRYQMVQSGDDFVSVIFGEPKIYIDCNNSPLDHFKWETQKQIVNQINDSNRPNKLVQKIATGRIEHREATIVTTLAMTVLGSLGFVCLMWYKSSISKIYV